jgi:diguanylate cyclase (GGDEF)-like protein
LLLVEVAKRLSACLREGDTIARLGGDEFVVMLQDLCEDVAAAAAQAEGVGRHMLSELNRSYVLDGRTIHSTASMGVALFADRQVDIDELLKQADMSMYEAKDMGRNTLRFFEPKMQAAVTARAALETGLRTALAQEQFVLHYQIQVSGDGQPTGAPRRPG